MIYVPHFFPSFLSTKIRNGHWFDRFCFFLHNSIFLECHLHPLLWKRLIFGQVLLDLVYYSESAVTSNSVTLAVQVYDFNLCINILQ